MDGDYWFARDVVNGRVTRFITPLNWKGVAVFAGFVLAMLAGGALFLVIALLSGNVLAGAAVFAVSAIAGAGTMLWASTAKCQLVTINPAAVAAAPARWNGTDSALSIVSSVAAGAIAFAAIYLLFNTALFAALAFVLFVVVGALMSLWAVDKTDVADRSGQETHF